ncbi:MAG: hypothetical protein QOE92_1281 [Chloroflexota bacterium]|jgi:hypothetical protein|nr:hypothetical protein [Chloroflexota bacterium]
MSAPHPTDEQLSARLDGALAAAEAAEVESHMAGCAECRGRVDMLDATRRAVAGLPAEDLPRPLDLGFLRVPAEPVALPLARRSGPPAWALAGLAAAAVVAVSLVALPRVMSPVRETDSGLSAGLGQAPYRGELTSLPASPLPGTPVPEVANDAMAAQAPLGGVMTTDKQSTATASSTLMFPGAANIKLRVTAGGGTGRVGSPLTVGLEAFDPGTDQALDPAGMQLVVRRDDGASEQVAGRVGGSAGVTSIPAHESRSLAADWTAGSVKGQLLPGTYTLVAQVYLSGGRLLEVPLTITVGQ